jgi:hypothetical protein
MDKNKPATRSHQMTPSKSQFCGKCHKVLQSDFIDQGLTLIKDQLLIQCIRKKEIYASEDHWVFKSVNQGLTWEKVCRLEPAGKNHIRLAKDLILRMDWIRKIRRNIGIHNLIVLPSGTILIQYDGIYRFDGTGSVARKVFDFQRDNIMGPLKNGFVTDERTGNVYWGEYNINRPYRVKILRGTNDGNKWEVCYRFPLGRIRHVHSIVPDYYRDCLWICTGDNDEESGLFFTRDDFKTVQQFNGGDQSWRMVSVIPKENALFWGSDAGQDAPPDSLNHIYKWDFKTHKKKQLNLIDKPAYYSMVLENGTMVIGVHHEPGINRKVTPSADLWTSINGDHWQKILELPYEYSGRKNGTKYATIHLPLTDESAKAIFFTPLNTWKTDFNLMKVSKTYE